MIRKVLVEWNHASGIVSEVDLIRTKLPSSHQAFLLHMTTCRYKGSYRQDIACYDARAELDTVPLQHVRPSSRLGCSAMP